MSKMESPKTPEKKVKKFYRIEVAECFATSNELETREKELEVILGRNVGTAIQRAIQYDWEEPSSWEIIQIPIDELKNEEIEKLRSRGLKL